ncbi:hypothetical protein Tco_1510909, partial [Tanacetum coccineum]
LEKGAKGMLEDWDEVVSGRPRPFRLNGTSLIKNPTIIMLIWLFWFSKSLFVGYGGGVDPPCVSKEGYELSRPALASHLRRSFRLEPTHGAEAISSYCYSGTSILVQIWAWGWAYRRLSERSFHHRGLRVVGSGLICDATEFVGGGGEGEQVVVFGGPHPSGLKGTSLIKNPTIII